jgi:hypothetical protein
MVNGADSPDARTALSALWPPLLIAAEPARVPFDEPRFDDWWRTASRAPVEARQQGAVLLVGLLAALGREVPPPVWEKVYAASPAGAAAAPSQAYLQALGAAATAGRLGETVLLSLLNLGPGGPAAAHPLVLGEAVAALRRVGLEAEARQVALEAVLAREF